MKYCISCDEAVGHEHIGNHHKARIEGSPEYQAQIAKDLEAKKNESNAKASESPEPL